MEKQSNMFRKGDDLFSSNKEKKALRNGKPVGSSPLLTAQMRAIRIGIARFARRIGETCKTADVPAIDLLLLLFF